MARSFLAGDEQNQAQLYLRGAFRFPNGNKGGGLDEGCQESFDFTSLISRAEPFTFVLLEKLRVYSDGLNGMVSV